MFTQILEARFEHLDAGVARQGGGEEPVVREERVHVGADALVHLRQDRALQAELEPLRVRDRLRLRRAQVARALRELFYRHLNRRQVHLARRQHRHAGFHERERVLCCKTDYT